MHIHILYKKLLIVRKNCLCVNCQGSYIISLQCVFPVLTTEYTCHLQVSCASLASVTFVTSKCHIYH